MSGNPETVSGTYDYIICGGGTAGCVIAGRLAEDPTLSILVIEAGSTNEQVPNSAIPAALPKILGSEDDWCIKSEPNPHLDNRQIDLARGKFLSGSSGANGTLCIRGSRDDYDTWGLDGWSGDELFDYMSKAESFQSKPWFEADEQAHGNDGPLLTAPHDPAPISKLMLDSYQSQGLPLIPDVFTTGESAHACGHAVRTVYKGIRSTAADYITKKNVRANVEIKTKVLVDKVLLEEVHGKLRATGVAVEAVDGVKSVYGVRKEIVICAGAYCSPAILLRSGIGQKEEVEKLGIKSIVDLPGVGKNLMDHLVAMTFFEVSKPDITHDSMLWHNNGEGMRLSAIQYQDEKTGFLSQFPFGTFAYARLDDRLADSPLWQDAPRVAGRDPVGLNPSQAHVEFWNTECYVKYKDYPTDGSHAFGMAIELFAPQSRGEVTLKSIDPAQNPVVDHNYLSEPLDLLIFSEACQLAKEIVMEGAGTKDIIKGSWPASLTHHSNTTREQWEPFLKNNADTCYHPAGTCKMGRQTDAMAVLDEELRVRGLDNLRVADASILPTLMSGHPQMAVYAIGEKAADMLKAAAASTSRM